MLVNAAEESFRRGKSALENDRLLEATALFEAAIELERRLRQQRIQARYLSFYGRCLAELGSRVHEGVQFCREAREMEPYDPDHYWNLGVALLVAGRKRPAFEALSAGLAMQHGHQGIRAALTRMGRRRRPVLRFLDRNHPINVLLGRMSFRRDGGEGISVRR